MSEINAIATNNYLLATQQEVSHDNSLSGNGTVDSPLGVVPGYNETVIYNGKLPNIGDTLQLTESWNNFKMIRVRGGDNTPEDHYYSNVSPSKPAFLISWAYNWMNQGYLKFTPTNDPNVWTYASNTYVHYTHNTSAVTVTQNDTTTLGSSCNFKIIGINRISG